MSRSEKELIAKIQISQLVTDDPFADDFYYQIHSSLSTEPTQSYSTNAEINWQQNLLMNAGKGNSMEITNQMQVQMQKLIEGRKQKPKVTQCNHLFSFL